MSTKKTVAILIVVLLALFVVEAVSMVLSVCPSC